MDRKSDLAKRQSRIGKILGKRGGAAKSTVDTSHALIGHGLSSFIQNLNLEMQGSSVRHIIGDERYELFDYLLHVAESNVLHLAQSVALEIDSAFDHVLFGEAEKFCSLLLLSSLAFVGRKEDEVDHLLIENPCRGEVRDNVASRYPMPLTVIHGEADIGYGGTTIILRHCAPRMPEGIDTIPVIACYAHTLAYLLYAGVGTGAEAVRRAESGVEGKQVLVIIGRGILLKYRQEQ